MLCSSLTFGNRQVVMAGEVGDVEGRDVVEGALPGMDVEVAFPCYSIT